MEQDIGVMIVVTGLLADRILFRLWERFWHECWGINSSG
jgi:hypothetical protein